MQAQATRFRSFLKLLFAPERYVQPPHTLARTLMFGGGQDSCPGQQNEKLTEMKQLFDVPDDFDDPNARYAIRPGNRN